MSIFHIHFMVLTPYSALLDRSEVSTKFVVDLELPNVLIPKTYIACTCLSSALACKDTTLQHLHIYAATVSEN